MHGVTEEGGWIDATSIGDCGHRRERRRAALADLCGRRECFFSVSRLATLYAIQRLPGDAPLQSARPRARSRKSRPQYGASASSPHQWQILRPRATMSYLTQMAGAPRLLLLFFSFVHNFLLAGDRFIALADRGSIRGFCRREAKADRQFWSI